MMCSTTSATKFRWSNVCGKHRKSATKEWSLGGNSQGSGGVAAKLSEFGLELAAGMVFRVFGGPFTGRRMGGGGDHVRLLQGCGNSVLVYGEIREDSWGW